ncbi:hypothetical protein B7494_g5465 [Chlorociboria aeruginascens]|nr:hypothetical protein B7494_g5465 [Chlorociboria aeruginascens]
MNSTRSIVAATRIAIKPSKNLPGSYARHSTSTKPKPLPSISPKNQNASRKFHVQSSQKSIASAVEASNPPLAFPCLDALESKSATLEARSLSSGPEPSYTSGATQHYRCHDPLLLDWGGVLPEFNIAYETWGEINADKSNVILLHTGLSASSHAHSTKENPKPGWWEKFIGPEGCLDTNKYHIICTNVIGGCYGSTGPSSIDPADGQRYATRFPILTMEDMVRAQFRLLDDLGIKKLYASVGASMGGMQSLAAGVLFPERVGRIASISGCARSHPYSIAMRHTQRQVLMMDQNWNRGFYYDRIPPHAGMKLAREIATVTYRSGPEWELRFGRRRADSSKNPALCPDFLIETYLDHAGEKFCLEYDANSLLYVSKAMDLFDLGATSQAATSARRAAHLSSSSQTLENQSTCTLTLPDSPYEEQPEANGPADLNIPVARTAGPPLDLVEGLKGLRDHPALVMGVASDILFPAWQQREIAETLRRAGNKDVTHVELGEDERAFLAAKQFISWNYLYKIADKELEENRVWREPELSIYHSDVAKLTHEGKSYYSIACQVYDWANRRWFFVKNSGGHKYNQTYQSYLCEMLRDYCSTYYHKHGKQRVMNVINSFPIPAEDEIQGFKVSRVPPKDLDVLPDSYYQRSDLDYCPKWGIPMTTFDQVLQKDFMRGRVDSCIWQGRDCVYKRIIWKSDCESMRREIEVHTLLLQAVGHETESFETRTNLVEERFNMVPILAIVVTESPKVVLGILMPLAGENLAALAGLEKLQGLKALPDPEESALYKNHPKRVPGKVWASTKPSPFTGGQLCDLMRGLHELFRLRITHGDVRSQNVLLKHHTPKPGDEYQGRLRMVLIGLGDERKDYKGDPWGLADLYIWCTENSTWWDYDTKQSISVVTNILRKEGRFRPDHFHAEKRKQSMKRAELYYF